MNLNIRPVVESDCETILSFIRELAIYEKAEHEVKASVDDIRQSLFGDSPKVFGLIAEIENVPVGFAIYFYNYSTWLGKHGIYLEDLYVSPASRGSGAGKALLKSLAQIATKKGLGRVEWSVLDWNTPAIDFYKAMGAIEQDEWTVYRLTGKALNDFANS